MLLLDLAGKGVVFGNLAVIERIEPAEPAILIAVGPERLVALPKLADLPVRAPLVGNFLDAFLQVLIERKLLPVDPVAENLNALVRDRAKELVGGIGKQPHPVADELVGDRLQRDAGAVDLAEHALRV